jgi:hypothetical protein
VQEACGESKPLMSSATLLPCPGLCLCLVLFANENDDVKNISSCVWRKFASEFDGSDVQTKTTTTEVKTLQVAKKWMLTQIEGLSDQREYELKRLLNTFATHKCNLYASSVSLGSKLFRVHF